MTCRVRREEVTAVSLTFKNPSIVAHVLKTLELGRQRSGDL